jgi:hypothetical protein
MALLSFSRLALALLLLAKSATAEQPSPSLDDATAPAAQPPAPSSLSVLFIGNSYTFVNDVPGMVQNISASAGLTLVHSQATKGGASLFQHANASLDVGRATLALLRSQHWDAVVLQDQSETAGGGRDTDDSLPEGEGRRRSLSALSTTYAPILRLAGSHAVLYETWGRKSGDPPNAACCGYGSFEGMNNLSKHGYELYAEALRSVCKNGLSLFKRHIPLFSFFMPAPSLSRLVVFQTWNLDTHL